MKTLLVKLKDCYLECVDLLYFNPAVYHSSSCRYVQQDMEQNVIYKHFGNYSRENISYLFSDNWNQVIRSH